MMVNSGQTCSATSRMLVPKARIKEAISVAREAVASVTVGDPEGNFAMGPVVSKSQFNSIQEYIQKGIGEGATLVAGGPSRPEGLDKGWFVKPTMFSRSQREEVFGPVLMILGHDSVDDATRSTNKTRTMLPPDRARSIALGDHWRRPVRASRLAQAGRIVSISAHTNRSLGKKLGTEEAYVASRSAYFSGRNVPCRHSRMTSRAKRSASRSRSFALCV
jgi:acyl-CoA reductase-like NAD-dependent aldehyde dehydrogenase